MSTPGKSQAILDELQALVEGNLPPERFADLQDRLKRDPALLREYLALVKTHHLLEERSWDEAPAAAQESEEESKVTPFPQFERYRGLLVAAATAAAVILFALLKPFTPPQSQDGLAGQKGDLPDFQFAAHAVFDATVPEERESGQIREGDVVALREGYVSIRLVSGAEAIIESPSSFTIDGPNKLSLNKGNATFHVPDSAIGFKVTMPWIEVVDLGTVFSVSADSEANIVYVEQGSVEARHPDLIPEGKLLVEGETLSCYRNEEIHFEADTSLIHRRDPMESQVLFHEVLSYVPDQVMSERQPLKGNWEVEIGAPWVRDGKLDTSGEDTEIFGDFVEPVQGGAGVVLLYLRAKAPENLFHSKGWAGISLFDGEHECFFIGDKSNDSYTWNFIPYGHDWEPGMKGLPIHDLEIQGGEESFTVRYHQVTGEVEIFRGWGVRGAPVLTSQMDPGLQFDRIRVGNSAGGDFSFEELEVVVLR